MSTTTLLLSAIIVFVLMLVGIVLTILEFKLGSPRQQEEAARAKSNTDKPSDRNDFKVIESKPI
jgi:hypothetical protein